MLKVKAKNSAVCLACRRLEFDPQNQKKKKKKKGEVGRVGRNNNKVEGFGVCGFKTYYKRAVNNKVQCWHKNYRLWERTKGLEMNFFFNQMVFNKGTKKKIQLRKRIFFFNKLC